MSIDFDDKAVDPRVIDANFSALMGLLEEQIDKGQLGDIFFVAVRFQDDRAQASVRARVLEDTFARDAKALIDCLGKVALRVNEQLKARAAQKRGPLTLN